MILNNDMEDMTIRYMWPGLGWLQGTISEYMGGDDVADPEGEQVYKVWFDDDGEDQGDVVLSLATYSALKCAAEDSWHVIDDRFV